MVIVEFKLTRVRTEAFSNSTPMCVVSANSIIKQKCFQIKSVVLNGPSSRHKQNANHTGADLEFLSGNWVMVTCSSCHLLPDPG